MADEKKFEARLRGRDLARALENYDASGLRAISEYTRQCLVIGAAHHDAEHTARISELCLAVNHLVRAQAHGASGEFCQIPPTLLKSIKTLVKALQMDISTVRRR